MDRFGSQVRSLVGDRDGTTQRPNSQPRPVPASSKSATELPPKPSHNGCTDVKPRLTKEQHDILEAHFQQQHKPSTSTKKGFAETLGVPLDKINNWFQNRRAKVKQDLKKQMNQMQMNMNMYGATGQMPMVTPPPQFPPHTEQQQPPTMAQDFYSVNADISSTHLPVDGVEGQPAMEPLGSQLSLHQGFDMHPLRPIPETDRSASYNHHAVMQSFMAAAAGAPYMQNNATSLAPQESGFSYDTNGLPQSFPGDLSFSIPASHPNENGVSNDLSNGFGDLSGFDYSSLTTTATSSSAPAQDSTGSISSEPSPFSGAQSSATTHSSGGPPASSVTSIASMYSNWKEDPNANTNVSSVNENDDAFGHPYGLPQAAASEQTLPFWGSSGHPFSQGDMYQHNNASASAILSSPGQDESRKFSTTSDLEPPPPFTDDIYQRRNSSTSNLANTIEGIHIQSTTPDGFKHPAQPSSLASRRHKRPAALNSSTLRSASYTSGMPSPGGNPNDHTLRRIRSGITSQAGRIQKPNQGAAQRSPLNLTFAESAASPKFARTFSSSSTTTLGQGGSLAPPTPLTPGANEMSRFPSWQSNTIIKNHQPMPEHSSPESLNVNWTVEPQSASMYSHTASPPSTPLDLGQVNQARIANESMYRDTPPQSAPATQQGFPRTAFVAPPLMSTGFHSTSDLTIMQPKPSHFRRPSLPDTNNAQLDVSSMQFPVQLGGDLQMNYDHQFNGMASNTQFAQSGGVPDFYVHEYSPPQGSGLAAARRAPEPQKNYIFANQGPHDFR